MDLEVALNLRQRLVAHGTCIKNLLPDDMQQSFQALLGGGQQTLLLTYC